MTSHIKVLVYGATGSQSSPIVSALLQKGHQPHVLTRNPHKAAAMGNAGATVVEGNLSDRASLLAASSGVDAVAFMVPAFLENPADGFSFARNAIDAARDAGVKLIVWNTSGPMLFEAIGNPMYDVRLDVAEYLRNSGVPAITLQPTVYMENLLGPWTQAELSAHNRLAYPVEEQSPLGWIATADVAALVVAALERPELAGSHFAVSGAENVTGSQLAERFSEGLERSITYRAMPLDEFGGILDQAFGPGAGDMAVAGYRFQREYADRIPMWAAMEPVLAKLPVRLTSIAEWAAQHREAFGRAAASGS